MINNVTVTENGSIEFDIDNSELLAGRADINREVKAQELLDSEGIGGIPGKEENKEKQDLKRTGWKEAKKATDVKHVCPICGTRYWGRPNKHYCGTPCKEVAKKRRSRKRKRDIRDFKPYRGKMGEVFFLTKEGDKKVISFVPAINAENRDKAHEYINNTYHDFHANYLEQVNTVILK